MTRDAAPAVSVELPSILLPVAGWKRLACSGHTIGEALDAAFRESPALRHHLMLDSGELRPHILCVLNDVTVPRDELRSTPVRAGDEILIHQAISGG